MNLAIITGASSGLGACYAEFLDHEGLDELWLIARQKSRLELVASKLKTRTRILSLDLTQEDSFQEIQEALMHVQEPEVRWLINCAGMGCLGKTTDIDMEMTETMISLNCTAPVHITQMLLPFMSAGSHIMNICSCAAFQPIPYLNIYAATKAFLLSYSRALSTEIKEQGILVTAVCPYWIKDTDFIPLAKATDVSHCIVHFPFSSKKAVIAKRSFAAAKMGVQICTPDSISFLHRIVSSLLPKSFLMWLSRILFRL
jgi:short-subunit dehydrogenase